jgi:chaperonin GroES
MVKQVLQEESETLIEPLVAKFECFGAQVLIKRLDEEKKFTPGGIEIPDTARERSQRGLVMLHGPGEYMSNGVFVPVQVKHGQTVLFSKYAGDDVEIEGQKYLLMHHSHVKLGEKQ